MIENLEKKAEWIRKETLKIHKLAPETRLASSLSCVEILTVLYYGGILKLKFDSKNVNWEERDRLIVSKAHGGIALYPILADLGFFDLSELENVSKNDSMLGAIPDCNIPGFEIVAGSLGHGLGIACGMAIGLKRKKNDARVFVICGDGELWEGSVWEAIMLGGHHELDNLILIVDNNKKSMLGLCKNIIDLEPLENKFKVFGWDTRRIDGHDVNKLYNTFKIIRNRDCFKPKVIIADTVKGKGVPELECDELCHIKCVSGIEIDKLICQID